jgi:hypothetical protein
MPTNDCAQKKRENKSAGGRTTIGVSMHGLFFVVLSTTTNNDEQRRTTTNNDEQRRTTTNNDEQRRNNNKQHTTHNKQPCVLFLVLPCCFKHTNTLNFIFANLTFTCLYTGISHITISSRIPHLH